MAITLNEAAKLSTVALQKGVIETMVRSSAVLELLPFMEIVGNAYSYNQVHELPEVGFRAVNEGYVESGSVFDLKSERLYMLGGDVDVDRFIAQTRGNVNDQRAIQTSLKAKAIAETFTKVFFHGNASTNVNEFDGLARRLEAGQDISVLDTNGTLTLEDLNILLDKVPYGAHALIMNRATRRIVMNILQANQHYIEVGQDAFGKPVTHYAGIPMRLVEDAILPANEIFAVRFGAMTDVCGLQNGGVAVQDLGQLETKPCLRTRIEWYVGLACFNPLSVARLKGIVK